MVTDIAHTRSRPRSIFGVSDWRNATSGVVRQQYDLIYTIPPLSAACALPRHYREKAAEATCHRAHAHVVEFGSGTGQNLGYLAERARHVHAVEFSGVGHRRAVAKHASTHRNISFYNENALHWRVPSGIDSFLFCMSYTTLPDTARRRDFVARLLHTLPAGGRIVILDARVPNGWERTRPFFSWLMRRTLLGNPHIDPYGELCMIAGADNVKLIELGNGSHFIACVENS